MNQTLPQEDKSEPQHVEQHADVKTVPVFAASDQEVARYLDPTVVIDDETNRRIKKLVSTCLPGPPTNRKD